MLPPNGQYLRYQTKSCPAATPCLCSHPVLASVHTSKYFKRFTVGGGGKTKIRAQWGLPRVKFWSLRVIEPMQSVSLPSGLACGAKRPRSIHVKICLDPHHRTWRDFINFDHQGERLLYLWFHYQIYPLNGNNTRLWCDKRATRPWRSSSRSLQSQFSLSFPLKFLIPLKHQLNFVISHKDHNVIPLTVHVDTRCAYKCSTIYQWF